MSGQEFEPGRGQELTLTLAMRSLSEVSNDQNRIYSIEKPQVLKFEFDLYVHTPAEEILKALSDRWQTSMKRINLTKQQTVKI